MDVGAFTEARVTSYPIVHGSPPQIIAQNYTLSMVKLRFQCYFY